MQEHLGVFIIRTATLRFPRAQARASKITALVNPLW